MAVTAFTHGLITRRIPMNKLFFAAMTLAVLGLAAGANVAVAAQKNGANSYKSYECFTDDGYGRKLPCSYSYQKRAERTAPAKSYDCFTDDRRLPCSYSVNGP
jgi:hypothetical protein